MCDCLGCIECVCDVSNFALVSPSLEQQKVVEDPESVMVQDVWTYCFQLLFLLESGRVVGDPESVIVQKILNVYRKYLILLSVALSSRVGESSRRISRQCGRLGHIECVSNVSNFAFGCTVLESSRRSRKCNCLIRIECVLDVSNFVFGCPFFQSRRYKKCGCLERIECVLDASGS